MNKLVQKCNLSTKVFFLGRVGKSELRCLYSNCEFFIFTSPYENFAYTLVEAMCCSAAIIATDSTAMPETCKNAALYFPPGSKEKLRYQISRLLKDENLKANMRIESYNRSIELNDYKEVNRTTALLISKFTFFEFAYFDKLTTSFSLFKSQA